ncbi:MAG: LamG-like jellyroll fold domain-containing protein, partial [Nanoarchaeota archaeon]
MQTNKELKEYIKSNLAKGYSLRSINKVLASSGCDFSLVNSLTSEYSIRPKLLRYSFIFILLAVLFSSLFFIKPSYVGYVSVTKEVSFTDDIALVKNTTTDYLWLLDDPADLNSIKLSGSVSAKGTAKVYIENNGQSYLIFDSEKLSEKAGLPGITSLSSLESAAITDNSTIKISLEYNEGSVYDDDDNGIEFTDGIIDFTVKNSVFDLDEEKLCTQWIIESLDNNAVSKICYGNKLCCNFINLEPADDLWNNPFYLNYNAYSAGYSNIVSVQILYVDYDLSLDNPYTNIQSSKFMNLSAVFYPKFIGFDDICLESCALSGFNDSLYSLIIEVDGAILNLDSIKYTTLKEVPNRAPFFNAVPSYKIAPGEELTINLSNYAYDLDNDTLVFSSSPADNLTIDLTNSAVRITPDNFQGRRFIYFIANDSVDIAVSNTIEINVVKNLVINKSESLKQGIAVIGKPVKWVKTVALNDTMANLSINISDEALNFTVKKVVYGIDEEISADKIKVIHEGVTRNVSDYVNEKKIEIIDKEIAKLESEKQSKARDTTSLKAINKKLVDYENEKNQITGYAVSVSETKGILTRLLELILGKEITGFAVKEKKDNPGKSLGHNKTVEIIIDEEVEDVEVEYYTAAPTATEVLISDNIKQIIVSSDIHYENITTYTTLSPEAKSNFIRLYWLVNGTRKPVDFDSFDNDGNGLIDYIQWITPHLSNQTYELVIEITKAEHLDTNRSFISDIYDYVNEKDGNWSEAINDSEYVRITFESDLTSDRDITLYARSFDNSSSGIDVYEVDGEELIVTFENISGEGWYKVYLDSLKGSQNVFDLKINGVVEFDYIVDPASAYNISFVDPTPANDTTIRNTYVGLNVSIEGASDLEEVKYNWDGTNFTIFNDSLILMMNFDNVSALGENDTHIYDISGNGNNGTAYGNARYNVSGRYGGGFHFKGVNGDYVDTPFVPDPRDSTSIVFWIKLNVVNAPQLSGVHDTSNRWYCGIDNTNNLFVGMGDSYIGSGVGNVASGISVGKWAFYAVTTTGSYATVYIDGARKTGFSYSASGSSGRTFWVGARDFTSAYYPVNGIIDELKIWNRTLSADEVYQQYVGNLKKFNQSQWYLYVNQSQNATDGLSERSYTYQVFAKDSSDIWNFTDLRSVEVDLITQVFFVDPTLDNATTTENPSIEINVSIENVPNLDEAKFNWNGTNYTIYNDSLVLMFNFDNVSALGENSTHVVDLSQYGNNGTWYDGGRSNGTAKYGTYSGWFDGLNDFINVSDSPSISMVGDFTIQAWIYPTSKEGNDYILGKFDDYEGGQGQGSSYDFFLQAGNISVHIADSNEDAGTNSEKSKNSLPINTWSHVAAVYNAVAGTVALYENGARADSSTFGSIPNSIPDTPTPITIGKLLWRGGNYNYFNGTIDEVRIWNRSLSAGEVQQLYMSNLNKYDTDKWYLYVNQSLNATDGLSEGTYTYQAFAEDNLGNSNRTESRTVTVDSVSPFYISQCSNLTQAGATYYLDADIIDSSTNYCIKLVADNITFDCQGHTIDGDDIADYGVGLSSSANSTLRNCIITDWDTYGLFVFSSSENSLIENVNISSCIDYGIYLSSDNVTFVNVNSSSNGQYGIFIAGAARSTIINSTFSNNSIYDFFIDDDVDLPGDCDHALINVNGTGNKPIAFFSNTAVTLEHWNNNVSEIFICNASGSVLNNITLTGDENNGIYLLHASDSTLTDINVTGMYGGLQIYYASGTKISNLHSSLSDGRGLSLINSDSVEVSNSTISYNGFGGILLSSSDNCVLSNLTVFYNGGRGVSITGDSNTVKNSNISNHSISTSSYGLWISGNSNKFVNVIFSNNRQAVVFDNSVNNNFLINSTIEGCTSSPIQLINPGSNNKIYNNLLKNINKVSFIAVSTTNKWNTTSSSATNIIGDPAFGGNYWTNSTGNGFSDTCTDADGNGYCDSAYDVDNDAQGCTSDNCDYLPLSSLYGVDSIAPTVNFTQPTPGNNTLQTQQYFEVNFSIKESSLNEVIYNWNGTNYTIYNDSLVLMFNFDNVSALGEGTSDNITVDLSRYGNNGTIYNMSAVGGNYTTGRYGKGLSFDGIDDLIIISDDSSLDITTAITLSAWVKYSGTISTNEMILARQGDEYDLGRYSTNNGAPQAYISGASTPRLVAASDVSFDNWHLVVVTYDSSVSGEDNFKIYLDSVLSNSTEVTGSITTSSNNVGIGAYPNNANPFNGTIDEVRIWNRSLSAQEIQILYMSNLKKYDKENWSLYINQSKNSTAVLTDGSYTYKAYATDTAGNLNSTEQRTMTIDAVSPFYITNCSTLDLEGATYILTQDILNSKTANCMNISVNNITLDCHGHTIDGDDSADIGIRIYRDSFQTTNITIKNCVLSNWDFAGIYLDRANYNRIENVTVSSCPDEGIYLDYSDFNTLVDVNSSSSDYGLLFSNSANNSIINSTFRENLFWDFMVKPASVSTYCDHQLINVTGTGNKPIVFYNNTAVTLEHWNNNVSEILLCNCDNSVLNNITLMNSTRTQNNGIFVGYTSDSNLTNISVTGMENAVYLYYSSSNTLKDITSILDYDGIYLEGSDSNILTNINVTSCDDDGIELSSSDLNTLNTLTISSNADDGLFIDGNSNNVTDCNISYNGDDGIYVNLNLNIIKNSIISHQNNSAGDNGIFVDDDNNQLINLSIFSNRVGIRFDVTADGNVVVNSTIENNFEYAINLGASGAGTPHQFYNNLFNHSNTSVIWITSTGAAYYNTTESSATNIIGYPAFGGNYWTNSSGTGYSDTCADSDSDGFCDNPYNVSSDTACIIGSNCGNNVDYLPLSNMYGVDQTYPGINFTYPTSGNKTVQTQQYVDVNVSIKEPSLKEVIYNWNGTNYTIYNDSLVLMFNFDNVSELGENSTHVVDLSKYSNNGTWYGGGRSNGTAKYGSYSGTFDGTDDCLNVTDSNSLRLSNLTISLWINPKGNHLDSGRIIEKYWGTSAPYSSYIFRWGYSAGGTEDADKVYFDIGKTGTYTSASTLTDDFNGKWSHIVGTYDHNYIKLYVNGVLENSTNETDSIIYTDGPLYIGRYGSSGFYYNGSIDEVRIWNRSLSAAEIQLLYMSNLKKYDSENWSFYVNQTKNATADLTGGVYTYQAFAQDNSGNLNFTELRTITTGVGSSYCGNLDTIGTTYTLIKDVSSSGTCFTLGADNITLDCAGHTITGAQNGYGINASGRKNITIKNCPITNFARAVNFISVNNSILNNLTIYNNNGDVYGSGIYFSLTDYTTVSNSNFSHNNASKNAGLYMDNSDYNTVENNTFEYNTVIFNGGNLLGGGILGLNNYAWYNSFDNNTFSYNNVSTLGVGDYIYGGGIIGLYDNSNNNAFTSSALSNNLIFSSNVYGGGGIGLYDSSNYNIFIASTVSDNNITITTILGGGGIGLRSSSINNFTNSTVSDNIITTSNTVYGGGGIGIRQGSGNKFTTSTISNNNITSNYVYGGSSIGVYLSAANTFTSSIVSNNQIVISSSFYGGGIIGLSDSDSNILTTTNISDNNITSDGAYGGMVLGIYSSDSNNIYYSTFTNNTASATNTFGTIGLDSSSASNTFRNPNVADSITWKIYDNTGIDYSNYLIYNNPYGEIDFIDSDFRKNLSVQGNLSWGENIKIENNHILVNSSRFSAGRINSSANITIYSLDYVDAKPQVDLEDDGTYLDCISGGNPSCNKLSYSVGTLIFNTTHFTSFRAQDAVTPGINFTQPTPGNATIQSQTSVEVNVSILNAADLDEVIYNWNGTNYTLYNDSLILMLNFDNVSGLGENYSNGSTDGIKDLSKYGNNGTFILRNGSSGGNVTGKYGLGWNFDGDGDFVNITLNPDLEIGDLKPFTIGFWAYPKMVSGSSNQGAVSALDGTKRFFLKIYDGDWIPGIGSYVDTTTSVTADQDTWQHMVLLYEGNGNNILIYKDGALVYSEIDSGDGDIPSYNIFIGADDGQGSPTQFFNGTIDEVRIWNRSLSAEEIQILYMSNLKKYDSENWSLYVNQSKNSTAGLTDGSYTYKAYAQDIASNLNQTETRTITIDNGGPQWAQYPKNKTIAYRKEWLTIDINATDVSDVTYYVNDTSRFNISIDGVLGNSSLLPVGVYYVNVTANDTFNHRSYLILNVNVSMLFYLYNSSDVTTNEYNISGDIDKNITTNLIFTNSQWANFTHATWGKRLRVWLDFNNSDINLTSLVIGASATKTSVNISAVTGIGLNHTIFIPKVSDEGVYVCPNAISLSYVNAGCSGIIRFSQSEAEAGTWKDNIYAVVEGNYFRIDNLTGSGGGDDSMAPRINFTLPTPGNNTRQTRQYFDVNVSITESSLKEVIYNWNGTNYTIYNDSLVLMMNFDNVSALGENSTHVKDLSRCGNNGTWNGTGRSNSTGRYGGYAGSFNGSGEHLHIPGGDNLKITGRISIQAWIKTTDIDGGAESFIVSWHKTGVGNGWFLEKYNDKAQFWYGCSGAPQRIDSGITVNDGRWHHLVGIYNGSSTIYIYVDGIQSNSGACGGDTAVASANIGIGAYLAP